jgi:hypothetical protein
MVAPEVASLSVTLVVEAYVPAAGENVGVAALGSEMVYVALPTELVVKPLAVAIALIVCVALTEIGPA